MSVILGLKFRTLILTQQGPMEPGCTVLVAVVTDRWSQTGDFEKPNCRIRVWFW